MKELFIGIICAVVGVLAQKIIESLEEYNRNKKRSDIQGEWHSVSHGGEDGRVEDHVKITMQRGKIYLVNKDKPSNYSYQAHCEIKDNHILTGEWKSLLDGASVTGNLLLLISPHGRCMYGIYSGVNKEGKPMLLGWALGKDREALLDAEELLSKNLQLPVHIK